MGEIGKAEAVRETRIRTAAANAEAVKGENEAKINIANSDAVRREKEAEALRRATAAEKVAQAQALEESYAAEQKAEDARATRERATQNANVIVKQEIEKKRLVIEAEAAAEQKRVNAKGEADAIYAKMEAEAKGLYQILTKQADGYDKMIQAAGGDATKAYTLLLLEKLPELVKTQVEAIKGINIDKVTVWDNGSNADGKGSTANFLSGLMKCVPPLNELFEQAGMSLPEYLGKTQPPKAETSSTEEEVE
jgi:flotillin